MIKEGMFVRCPIDREYPYDPRIFVTGKVLSINEFNETAYIKFSVRLIKKNILNIFQMKLRKHH